MGLQHYKNIFQLKIQTVNTKLHLKHLRLKVLQAKTIDAYVRAIVASSHRDLLF